MNLFSFFDVTLFRLVFTLFVDYLVSTGFLLPEQRQLWVDGYSHIIGVAGAVIFLAIYQHHAHKLDMAKIEQTTAKSNENVVMKLFNTVIRFVFMNKKTAQSATITTTLDTETTQPQQQQS